MNLLKKAWDWTKSHLDAINLWVIAVCLVAFAYVVINTVSTQNELKQENLILQQKILSDQGNINQAIIIINHQQKTILEQQNLIRKQEEVIKQMFERIKYLENLLNGEIA